MLRFEIIDNNLNDEQLKNLTFSLIQQNIKIKKLRIKVIKRNKIKSLKSTLKNELSIFIEFFEGTNK